jgi:hypothetical protein
MVSKMGLCQEPSLLEYARFYKVSTNHLTVNPLAFLPSPLESVNDTLSAPKEAPDIGLSLPHDAVERKLRGEKLEIDRNGATFLSSIIKDESSRGAPVNWDNYLPDYKHYSNLKLDVPLLNLSDECHAVFDRPQSNLDLAALDIPLETTENENDDGLEFPGYVWALPDEAWEEILSEKLDCPREALPLLQEIHPPEALVNEDLRNYFQTRLHFVPVRRYFILSIFNTLTIDPNRKGNWSQCHRLVYFKTCKVRHWCLSPQALRYHRNRVRSPYVFLKLKLRKDRQ